MAKNTRLTSAEPSKEPAMELDGIVLEALPNAQFKVEVQIDNKGNAQVDNKNSTYIVTAHPSGKIRKNNIRIIVGDSVRVEVTPYDLTKGRIVWRTKGTPQHVRLDKNLATDYATNNGTCVSSNGQI